MTFGSLFAGIGGFDLGLERAGMECRWQVEIDPFCRKVLEKHWPDVKRYEDVREVGADELEYVDLICGGFPCQDISVAGKGEGIGGERSGLWAEMWRCVREIRPRYVLVENVPALRSRGLDRVLGDLAAIGYDTEWDCLPAAAFGAPHRRDRLFLVAHTDSERGRPPEERERGQLRPPQSGDDGEARAVADTASDGRGQGWPRRPARLHPGLPDTESTLANAYREPMVRPPVTRGERDPWAVEPDVGRVADGIPARVDRLRALGNAVVPQVSEWIGHRILAHHRRDGT